jgi:hypothetical protein
MGWRGTFGAGSKNVAYSYGVIDQIDFRVYPIARLP